MTLPYVCFVKYVIISKVTAEQSVWLPVEMTFDYAPLYFINSGYSKKIIDSLLEHGNGQPYIPRLEPFVKIRGWGQKDMEYLRQAYNDYLKMLWTCRIQKA